MGSRSKELCTGGAVKIAYTDVSVTDLRCTAKPTKDGRFVGRILAITLLLEAVDRVTAARSSVIRSTNAL